ncbi:MAG TPA: phosphosugar isomerase [Paracoccus sp. (in: a-proteobacteria)]|uniref:phosphosugar isomerase n=1 Tax=Paracoccus sp. TaxID=267 RepID=UPI002C2EAC52|nr:phosphosugar isomerase [Paracoccus sp. (in: a-proteobacteria)]HWL56572.1 phosphosugar isomerase [Paracoccus sp. (in: a-proteobacteria)]
MTSFTAQEIDAQPAIWRGWADPLEAKAAPIRDWIAARAPHEVWLSGAGTSAYLGEVLSRQLGGRLRSFPTTDLVAVPQLALGTGNRDLSVQFGRSGDSSETVGLIDLLDLHRPDIDRLQITCNADSALGTRSGPGPGQTRALILPEATHDRGFAMTSSFTTMYLSALACLDPGFDARLILPRLAEAADRLLPRLWGLDLARPDRAIFLGSGALTGIARESALKVLELTAGRTITQWDSTLGFRHGPKAAVDEATSVFVMIHPDPQVARYDLDLANEIRNQFPGIPVVTIGRDCDIPLALTDTAADPALYVLPAQILAHRWSEALGLPVDDPFAGRNLTRVVSGVRLYEWQA